MTTRRDPNEQSKTAHDLGLGPTPGVTPLRDGAHDFDFLHGQWSVHHRRLRRPLSGLDDWYEFEGTAVEHPLFDGQGNLEEVVAQLPTGQLRAVALRLYSPGTRQWSIHWANSANGTLDHPMIGDFRNGRGEFYAYESIEGRAVFSRFIWTRVSSVACRWEQAFSPDGGTTWETNWIMEFTRLEPAAVSSQPSFMSMHTRTTQQQATETATSWPVVELRQYTLHPRQRDTLIALFEREFIETQEAAGMQVIAQFRDIDRPDVFIWLRGFADMPARATALAAFYGGPVWAAHRDAANDTMMDSDNVRLLRPAQPNQGFMVNSANRVDVGSRTIPPGLFVTTIYTLTAPAAEGFANTFERDIAPELVASGGRPLAALETELSANNFPRLPVREGEYVFVWFAQFASLAEYDRHVAALEASNSWRESVRPVLERHFSAPPEILRLTPTARSLIR